MCASVHVHMCVGTFGSHKKGHQTPWSWNCRLLLAIDMATEDGVQSFARTTVLLASEPRLWPLYAFVRRCLKEIWEKTHRIPLCSCVIYYNSV